MRSLAVAALTVLISAAPASGARAAEADPLGPSQWALDAIDAESAWATTTGRGVRVAVIDSGVATTHEDLAGKVVASAACSGTRGEPARCGGSGEDGDGHGTHVAGIVAASAGNGVGIGGVAPGASLIAVRVLSRVCVPQTVGTPVCRQTGSTSDIAAGLRWSVDRGARVVNLSIAPDAGTVISTDSPLGSAIEHAWSRGVIVVVAAGNDFGSEPDPALAHLPVVVVAATDHTGSIAAYSNRVGDARWAIAAPGGSGAAGRCPDELIVSTFAPPAGGEDYRCMYGTSSAAPHVSGALALLLGRGVSPTDAVEHLVASARDAGAPGRDPVYGAGVLDIGRAVATLPPPIQPGASDAASVSRPSSDLPSPPGASAAGAGSQSVTTPPATDSAAVEPQVSNAVRGDPVPQSLQSPPAGDGPARGVSILWIGTAALLLASVLAGLARHGLSRT